MASDLRKHSVGRGRTGGDSIRFQRQVGIKHQPRRKEVAPDLRIRTSKSARMRARNLSRSPFTRHFGPKLSLVRGRDRLRLARTTPPRARQVAGCRRCPAANSAIGTPVRIRRFRRAAIVTWVASTIDPGPVPVHCVCGPGQAGRAAPRPECQVAGDPLCIRQGSPARYADLGALSFRFSLTAKHPKATATVRHDADASEAWRDVGMLP